YPLPRAYVVWKASVAGSADDALKRTLDGGFDPGSEVVLEQPFGGPLNRPESPAQDVQIVRREPTETQVRVGIPAPGLLVVSQVYYPGWRAEVDGAPVELLRANYAFE